MIKTKPKHVINSDVWDKYVTKIYKRPYSISDQFEFKNVLEFKVPNRAIDFANEIVEEDESTKETGVNFKSWISRDPSQPISGDPRPFVTKLWWFRSFYPEIDVLANDLYKKGQLERGEYVIISSNL